MHRRTLKVGTDQRTRREFCLFFLILTYFLPIGRSIINDIPQIGVWSHTKGQIIHLSLVEEEGLHSTVS